jgi:hypothetical protein
MASSIDESEIDEDLRVAGTGVKWGLAEKRKRTSSEPRKMK